MEDIRLSGNDGDYLTLETADGEQYRLINDESLQAAVKKSRSDAVSSSLSPRELQDAVRNGATLEELVETSGASFDFVEKFAAPVIAELEHIIESAKTLRLPSLGEGSGLEFGEFVQSKLAALNASDIKWSTKRTDFNVWHISVSYQANGSATVAVWSFDPRKLVLSPENERAINLGKRENAPAAFLGGLVADTSTPTVAAVAAVETTKLSLVTDPATTSISDEVSSTISEPTVDVAEQALTESPANENAPLSATADLLQALRKKRAEASSEAQPQTMPIEIIAEMADESASAGPVQASDSQEQAPKKGRPSMPSWDQIVFGTKTDE